MYLGELHSYIQNALVCSMNLYIWREKVHAYAIYGWIYTWENTEVWVPPGPKAEFKFVCKKCLFKNDVFIVHKSWVEKRFLIWEFKTENICKCSAGPVKVGERETEETEREKSTIV